MPVSAPVCLYSNRIAFDVRTDNKNSTAGVGYLAKAAISLGGLVWVYFLLRDIDWAGSMDRLQNVSLPLFAGSALAVSLVYCLRLMRLRLWVGRISQQRLAFFEWIDLYLLSIAIGSITPSRLGEFSRIYLLRNTGMETGERVWVTVFDKLSDLLYIPVAIVLTAGVVGTKYGVSGNVLVLSGIVFLLAYFLLSYWFGRKLGRGALLAGWIFTGAGFFMFVSSNVLIFRAVDIGLNWLDIVAITVSVGALASLPVSIAGIGVREGSLLALLEAWGVAPEAILPVLVLEFIINILFPVLLLALWRSGTVISRRN
jgi:uncharacterized membrane protein YbhN (UPF0104 family)